eukprot:1866365-Prymnesium_polylepis.1
MHRVCAHTTTGAAGDFAGDFATVARLPAHLVQLFVQILEPRQHARSDAPARALRHAALPLDHVVECTAVGKLRRDDAHRGR